MSLLHYNISPAPPAPLVTSYHNRESDSSNKPTIRLPSIQELMPDYFTFRCAAPPRTMAGPLLSPPLSTKSNSSPGASPTSVENFKFPLLPAYPSPPTQHAPPPPPPPQPQHHHHPHHHQPVYAAHAAHIYHHPPPPPPPPAPSHVIPQPAAPQHVLYHQPPPQDLADQPHQQQPPQKKRRGNLPRPVTDILRNWLDDHVHHPYPTEAEKNQLMRQTGLTMNQISNWFINARRRRLPALHKNRENANRLRK
ncbi:hypothetical protein TRVA0_007S01332 [Trichomonascus vanleenenianus]|uniref:homeobox domain-containing protein n=1 Tax=Trichomonascus vanleenenianus TaxID=2268995 RepID=UPI003ECB105B